MSEKEQTISIFVVDASAAPQEFTAVLNEDKRISILGSSLSVTEAIQQVERLKPDVVVMRFTGDVPSEIGLIKELRSATPTVQALAILNNVDADAIAKLIESGVSGICSGDITASDILMVVRATASGSIWIAPSVAGVVRQLVSGGAAFGKGGSTPRLITAALTDRENEILRYMARGLSNQRIANELHLSVETVKTYVRRIMDKSSIRTRRQLLSQFEGNKAATQADAGE